MFRMQVCSRLVALLCLVAVAPAHAALVITEVSSSTNSNSTYKADWFELTNTGSTAETITGLRMDDNSNNFGVSVALEGIASLAAGQTVLFLNYNGNTQNSAAAQTALANAFTTTWWGSSAPSGLAIGFYADPQGSGLGTGLGNGGDAVNIFNASGGLVTAVSFGAADGSGDRSTFDNTAGLTTLGASQYSAVGVNGAFQSVGLYSGSNYEIGSPGMAASPVPLPAAAWLLLSGLGAMGATARRRRRI
jgi:hypothetical protein